MRKELPINYQLLKSRKYQQKAKPRPIQHMTLKNRAGNTISYIHDDKVDQDPERASLAAIRRHMNAQAISYDRKLFTIAQYDQGHYLIYDNKEVIAYTILLVVD